MSVADIDARLDRAKEQIEALHDETRDSLRKSYRIIADPQNSPPERWLYHVKAVLVADPPPLVRWAVLSGETVHNLRASLDNLAWILARSGAHGGTGFPLTDHQNEWAAATTGTKKQKAQTRGMKSDAINVIRGFQPYIDRKKNAPLKRLRLLSNRDKHRFLQIGVVAAFTQKVDFGRPVPEHIGKDIVFRDVLPPGPFDDNTVLAVVEVPANMQVKPDVAIEVLFGKGTEAENWPITNALNSIAEMIRGEVVPALYPLV